MSVKHQLTQRRKWQSAQRTARAHLPAGLPAVLCLTDPQRIPNPADLIACLPPGSGLVYRHFGARDRFETARTLQRLCCLHGLPFVVAADPTLAIALRADGLHWPEARLRDAMKWRGKFAFQTASAHNWRAIMAAARAGMDAVLVSTVFISNSPSARLPMGPLRFRKLCRNAPLAVYALGGIRAETAGRIADCSGLAAIDGLSALYPA